MLALNVMSVDISHQELVLEPYDSPAHPMAASFRDIRNLRSGHYASRPKPDARRTRAIITMVHNEPLFLPIWLRYYSRWFAPEDIYVLDNGSTDGSTMGEGFVRIPVEHETVDHTWMVRTIEQLQHDLISRYDITVVADVDEIIAVAPQLGGLGDYLDWFDEEWVNPLGYELVHMKDREPPLRLDHPILEQRRYWYVNGAYDKAALAMVPMTWKPGFHGREDNKLNAEPDLRLIHLHRMDFDLCLERHRTRRRKQWAELDAREGWAVHNQVVDDEDFARWFYAESGFESWGYKIQPEEIPAPWREVI